MSDRLAVLPQYFLPKRALTQFGSLIASARGGVWTTRLIHWFVGQYKVNMAEAADPDIRHYASF
ncbi:MAG: phosphatidylserine decarboxylase, partial [Rhodoferax sp.]|nr:phosphatidylserine decarboxylase [Rhodoferax sp.]